jgi:hypothetical protein
MTSALGAELVVGGNPTRRACQDHGRRLRSEDDVVEIEKRSVAATGHDATSTVAAMDFAAPAGGIS